MKKPISRQKMLSDIRAFCEKRGISTTEFGRLALGDTAFYGRVLREQRSPTLERIEMIYDFMAGAVKSNKKPSAIDEICS